MQKSQQTFGFFFDRMKPMLQSCLPNYVDAVNWNRA
jgi:hypothetical protein